MKKHFVLLVALALLAADLVAQSSVDAALDAAADAYWQESDFDRVIRIATDAIERYGATGELLAYRGSSHRVNGDLRAAEADFRRALRIDGDSAIVRSMYARLLLQQDREGDAAEYAEDAVRRAPRSPVTLYNAGRVAGVRGQYRDAIDHYSRALEQNRFEWPVLRSNVLNNLGRSYWDLADEVPESSGYLSGIPAEKRENLERAYETFTELIEYDPDYYFGYYNRGRLGIAFPSPLHVPYVADSDDDLTRAIGLRPDSAYAYAHRARVRRHFTNRYDDQLADIDRAIELDNDNAYFRALRGFFMRVEGDYEGAVESLDRAISLSGQYQWAIRNRALAHTALGDAAGICADYRLLDRVTGGLSTTLRRRRAQAGVCIDDPGGEYTFELARVSDDEAEAAYAMFDTETNRFSDPDVYKVRIYVPVEGPEQFSISTSLNLSYTGTNYVGFAPIGAEWVSPDGARGVLDTAENQGYGATTFTLDDRLRSTGAGYLRIDVYALGSSHYSLSTQEWTPRLGVLEELTVQLRGERGSASQGTRRNYVVNGGFESGFGGFERQYTSARTARFRVVDGTSRSGRNSLRVTNQDERAPHVYRTFVQRVDGLERNTDYRVSYWARGVNATSTLTLNLIIDGELGGWRIRLRSAEGTFGWQQFSGVYNTGTKDYFLLRFITEDSGAVYVDDIEVTRARGN